MKYALRSFRLELLAVCLCSTVLILSFSVNAQEMYKSVDAQGRVVYSDRPMSESAQRVVVRTPRPDAESAQTSRERALAAEQADTARKASALVHQDDLTKKKEAENQREDNCRQARDRYQMFTERPRLYRRDAQGNRVYYSSEEIDLERATAQKGIADFCEQLPRSR